MTVAQETASQIALRNCSEKVRGGGQYTCDFSEGGTCNQTHLGGGLLLVTRNRCLC